MITVITDDRSRLGGRLLVDVKRRVRGVLAAAELALSRCLTLAISLVCAARGVCKSAAAFFNVLCERMQLFVIVQEIWDSTNLYSCLLRVSCAPELHARLATSQLPMRAGCANTHKAVACSCCGQTSETSIESQLATASLDKLHKLRARHLSKRSTCVLRPLLFFVTRLHSSRFSLRHDP